MNIKKTGVEKLDAEAASKNLYGITVPIITAETTEEEGRNNPRAPFYAVYKFILNLFHKEWGAVIKKTAPHSYRTQFDITIH